MRIAPAYRPRFMSEARFTELFNLYHLSKTALSGKDCSEYKRILWASGELHKIYPDISATAAYKDLDSARSEYNAR